MANLAQRYYRRRSLQKVTKKIKIDVCPRMTRKDANTLWGNPESVRGCGIPWANEAPALKPLRYLRLLLLRFRRAGGDDFFKARVAAQPIQERLPAMIAMLSSWYASDSYSTTGSTRGSPTSRQSGCRRRLSRGGSPPNFATITCWRSPCHVAN